MHGLRAATTFDQGKLHLQFLGGAAALAHMARHTHAAHNGAWKQTLTNGTVTAMPSFGAVCHIAATEAVAFDHAFKPPAFRDSDRIDKISFNKKGRADYVARFHFLGKIAEFFDAFDGKGTEFFDMTEQRFGHPALLLIFKTKLNSFVPVAFHGFALDH